MYAGCSSFAKSRVPLARPLDLYLIDPKRSRGLSETVFGCSEGRAWPVDNERPVGVCDPSLLGQAGADESESPHSEGVSPSTGSSERHQAQLVQDCEEDSRGASRGVMGDGGNWQYAEMVQP